MAVDSLVDSAVLDAALTSVADAIRAKGGTSAQLAFPAGFVSAVQAIPTGGGGATVVASGTVTGGNAYDIIIPLGTNAPLKNFYLEVESATGIFAYDTNYKVVRLVVCITANNELKYQSTTDGAEWYYADKVAVTVDDSGTQSTVESNANPSVYNYVRQAAGGAGGGTSSALPRLQKTSTGISIRISANTSRWTSGHTYNWKLVYFGGNYANESISI